MEKHDLEIEGLPEEGTSADETKLEQTKFDSSDSQPAYKKLLIHEQIEHLEAALQEAESKKDENWDKLLRAMAELENVKRRAERDVSSAHKYALNRFIEELIPVLDSLDQALLSCSDDFKSMREGIEMTQKMFMDKLQKFGVKILNPLNEMFDANLHEAMMMEPSSEAPVNSVLTVIQKGYKLHDRLIRPARVIVAQAPT